jgi:hypothetical protein
MREMAAIINDPYVKDGKGEHHPCSSSGAASLRVGIDHPDMSSESTSPTICALSISSRPASRSRILMGKWFAREFRRR